MKFKIYVEESEGEIYEELVRSLGASKIIVTDDMQLVAEWIDKPGKYYIIWIGQTPPPDGIDLVIEDLFEIEDALHMIGGMA